MFNGADNIRINFPTFPVVNKFFPNLKVCEAKILVFFFPKNLILYVYIAPDASDIDINPVSSVVNWTLSKSGELDTLPGKSAVVDVSVCLNRYGNILSCMFCVFFFFFFDRHLCCFYFYHPLLCSP